jgi:hypothetical protein
MDRTDRPAPTGPLPVDAAAFARAAGAGGIAANALLIGFFASRGVGFSEGEVLGPANDLVGSLTSAVMVPVAVSLRPLLPTGRAVQVAQAAGIASMCVLAANGPLLVLGVVPFGISTAISISAAMVFAGWLFTVNRWMRRARTLRESLARWGQVIGAATLVSGAGAGAALVLLPRNSTAQFVALGITGLPGVLAWLATPVWFLRLGSRAAAPLRPSRSTRPLQGAQS